LQPDSVERQLKIRMGEESKKMVSISKRFNQ